MRSAGRHVILLAVYNGKTYLAAQLDSLLSQTAPGDILIRDDGSTDGSQTLLQEYASLHPCIHLVDGSRSATGPESNFSTLLEMALISAEYEHFFFSDQDDVWLKDKVSFLLALASQTSTTKPLLIHSDLAVVNAEGAEVASSFFKYQGLYPKNSTFASQLVDNTVTGCTMMINRSLAELAAPVPAQALMHDWWIALIAAGCGDILVADKALVRYRQHGANLLGARKDSLKDAIHLLGIPQKWDLHRYYEQAAALQTKRILDNLKPECAELLADFLSTRCGSPVARLKLMRKAGIQKHSRLKNMLLKATAGIT